MNIEEIKDRVNLTKNAFHKLGIEGQININLMLNDIEFLLTAYEKEKEDKKLIDKNRKEIFEKYEKEKEKNKEHKEKIIYWLDRLDLEEELQDEYDELDGCRAAVKILKQLLKGNKTMTDEEKKAIEWLKKADWFSARLYAPTILNLIEKQSKEIEELKKPKYIINFETNEITTLTNDFISKDKIKAKIEELKKQDRENRISHNYLVIPILQSLLEKE